MALVLGSGSKTRVQELAKPLTEAPARDLPVSRQIFRRHWTGKFISLWKCSVSRHKGHGIMKKYGENKGKKGKKMRRTSEHYVPVGSKIKFIDPCGRSGPAPVIFRNIRLPVDRLSDTWAASIGAYWWPTLLTQFVGEGMRTASYTHHKHGW